nr:MAG: internal scaffolding protein [Microvirus sp.]
MSVKLAVDDFGFGFDPKTGQVLVSPIRTLFMPSVDQGIDCSDCPSLTVQADLPGTDLNTIMSQYERTGFDAFADRKAQGVFADLASMPDFRAAQDTILRANDAFSVLPAKTRLRFNNDPAEFLAFFDDESNLDEAIRLGLVDPLPPAPLPEEPKASNPRASKSPSSKASEDGE